MKSNISHCLFMLVLGARCTQLSISWRKIINLVAGLGLVWAHTTGSLRLGADMEAVFDALSATSLTGGLVIRDRQYCLLSKRPFQLRQIVKGKCHFTSYKALL